MILIELKQRLAELLTSICYVSETRTELLLLDGLFFGEGSLDERALYHLLQQTYGGGVDRLKPYVVRLIRLCDLFSDLYGDGEVIILRAPARINILGEHV